MKAALPARAWAATSDGGGRVTEICARPLINLFYPELAGFAQPLSGEAAGRRDLLRVGAVLQRLRRGDRAADRPAARRRASARWRRWTWAHRRHVNQPTAALGADGVDDHAGGAAARGRRGARARRAWPATAPTRGPSAASGGCALEELDTRPRERPPMAEVAPAQGVTCGHRDRVPRTRARRRSTPAAPPAPASRGAPAWSSPRAWASTRAAGRAVGQRPHSAWSAVSLRGSPRPRGPEPRRRRRSAAGRSAARRRATRGGSSRTCLEACRWSPGPTPPPGRLGATAPDERPRAPATAAPAAARSASVAASASARGRCARPIGERRREARPAARRPGPSATSPHRATHGTPAAPAGRGDRGGRLARRGWSRRGGPRR